MMAGLGLSILLIFVMALWLTPDPRGFGTHQQLRLPECSFRKLTGTNCPHCGITTSLCYLVRGQLAAAMKSNASGILLAIVLAVLMPWCFMVSWHGRWLIVSDPVPWLIYGALMYLGITCLLWMVRQNQFIV